MKEEIKETATEEQKDPSYIKLSRNSKGYNWEIKTLENTSIETLKEIKERLLKINQELVTELLGD